MLPSWYVSGHQSSHAHVTRPRESDMLHGWLAVKADFDFDYSMYLHTHTITSYAATVHKGPGLVTKLNCYVLSGLISFQLL